MKIFLRLLFLVFLIQFALKAAAQPCNGTVNIQSNSGNSENIRTTSATLKARIIDNGAGNNCNVEIGAKWSTTNNFDDDDNPTIVLSASIPSDNNDVFIDVTGLPPGTQIYYRIYISNNNNDDDENFDVTDQRSFTTLSLATEPGAHAASLTATAQNSEEILLGFPAANTISNADGYIILYRENADPDPGDLQDGEEPDDADYFLHTVTSGSATGYLVSGLAPGRTYHFTVIPYNRQGSNVYTANYRTSPGYPIASATTAEEVDISPETGGLASGTLNAGTNDVGLMGFTLDASGPVVFQSVVFSLSSTTSGKFTNFRLVESTDDDNYDTSDPELTAGVSHSVSPTQITFTLSENLTGATDRHFFLVADVDPTVNDDATSVTFSYNQNSFTFSGAYIDGPVSQSRPYSFHDGILPELQSTFPADDATVDFTLSELTLTFNENVDNITTGASGPTDRIIIYDAATNLAVVTVDRVNVNGDGTPVVTVPIPPGVLEPNSDYYVWVGSVVIEDVPGDNDWGGISDPTEWNFSTSGVTVNNANSNICSGSFQSIADIVISEEAAGDFITDGVINLDFANANFGYDITSATVSAGPAGSTDITAIKLDPKTLTRLTLEYELDGNNDQIDVITISGLRIYASAAGSTTIYNNGSIAGIWAAKDPITFATITVGTATPAAPVLEAAQDLMYCANEDISAATVAVENETGTFTWYSNASLSTPLASGHEVAVSDLNINPAVVGTVKRYVVLVDGCQSQPLEVTFEVVPTPVADAGPAAASLCSGASIMLGGSPTLIGPSVAGSYQYLWTDNPVNGFTDMGPNPVVSPTYHKDTTYQYTVKIIDANNCASDIFDPNATITVEVDSTDENLVYNSPLSTSFTLNSDPIVLSATPSNNSTYSGNGVYLSGGVYYFDPDLAGTANSPHAITYTTELSNGCPITDVRSFTVANASGSIINVAGSYCSNEPADPFKILSLGPDWQAQLENNNNLYYRPNGFEYEFFDFQATANGIDVSPGVVNGGGGQYIDPTQLQPYGPNYAYIGMRVRRHTFQDPVLGLPVDIWGAPEFWNFQYINLYAIPAIKVSGIKPGQILCDVDEIYTLEGSEDAGRYEISRDGSNWYSGPAVGIVDNPPNSGKANFNPHDAFTSTNFGGAPPASEAGTAVTFYIRYTYDIPGTIGSNSSACEATAIITFQISPNPSVAWEPLSETEFCYEAASVLVQTNPLEIAPNQITLSGYGIFDKGNGTATFDPDEALKAKAFATNSSPYTNYSMPESINISATMRDVNGCATTIQQTVSVHPLFPASFAEADLDVCYEDGAQDIVGGQANGAFELSHPNLTENFTQTTLNDFDLSEYFDLAVQAGADGTINQKFDLTFNTFDPVLGCQNTVTKTFNVKPPILMDIGGMTSGMIVCGNGAPFDLTGNQPAAGSFQISTSSTSGFVNNALGLSNTTSGKGTFTPAGAAVPAGDPQKSLYIRYSFLGPGCTGTAEVTEELIINPEPAIGFDASIPAPNTPYCFEQSATPTTVALATVPNDNVTFSGFGITDNGGGNAVFNPTSAYQQSSLADNLNPLTDQTVRTIVITAKRTDALNCANTTTVSYDVNPLPLASFTPAQDEFCYEDDPIVLSGAQTNVSYQFIYKNTTTPPNYSPDVVFQPTVSFDPEAFFDDAVSKGANPLATLQFDVIYTAISNTTGCVNHLSPVRLNVSPRIPVAISGVEDNEIYCSNMTDKVLEFSPPGGTFRINGSTEPFSNNQYTFNPPIAGPATGTDYTFSYTLITGNNCTNSLEKVVKVLPSPRALFNVQPQCDTALIPYHAQASTNLAAATYTWNFSGEIKTGQDVEHRFPGVSSYYAKLKVEHPPFEIAPGKYLVCTDSLQLDQVVGPYPRDIHFEYFNVCENDSTNFEVTSSVPINRVSWDFGDGESTPFGILSEDIIGLPKTIGTYQNPIHQFSTASDELNVKVIGKTADNFGGCPFGYETKISILKRWEPGPGEPAYDMSQLDNGKGFWVVEDPRGNATWEFDAPSKARINTSEHAWITGPEQPYKSNDVSYVNSPCFDLSSFARPVISIKHWTDTKSSDGAVLQYSVDGGDNWVRLGDVASGLDWYTSLSISSNPGEQPGLSSGWSQMNQLDWQIGKHTLDVLPQDRSQVRFRVAFSSFINDQQLDGFAFNNVVIEERNRTILLENFTTLNPAQKSNNDLFKAFHAAETAPGHWTFNSAELVKLQYHHTPAQNNAEADALNRENPADPNARAAFYGVTNPARAFIDGGFGQTSSNATFQSPALETYFSLRSLVSSPVDITIDFENEPADKLNVKATVKAMNSLGGPGQYNVFIAIAEQETRDQVYVLRKFLPGPSGTPLTSLSAADPAQEIRVSYDMRHVTRLPDGSYAPFAVIVFVQHLQTKDILQTVMRQDGTASSEIVTGIETPFDAYLRIFPNPADDVLNVLLPAPVKTETPLKIFDTFGRQVYAGAFKVGEHTKLIDTRMLSGGIYLIQLSTPEGKIRRKAMVVHE